MRMNNPQTTPDRPLLTPVVVAPIERWIGIFGLLSSVALLLLGWPMTAAFLACFCPAVIAALASWRACQYIIGLITEMAPVLRILSNSLKLR